MAAQRFIPVHEFTRLPVVTASGAKVTIPLTLARRGEFQGGKMSVKFFGVGFEQAPAIDITLTADKAECAMPGGTPECMTTARKRWG